MRRLLPALGHRRVTLIALLTAAVVAVTGTLYGYSALRTTVTLSVDGRPELVSAFGGHTVGDVLKAGHVTVGAHDVVAPSLDQQVHDGDRVSVRYGRQVTVSVDGAPHSYWVTATDVQGALEQIGLATQGAAVSASRGAFISRSGIRLAITSPKRISLAVGGHRAVRRTLAAPTVGDALRMMHVTVHGTDRVRPGLGRDLTAGTRIVVTRMRVVSRTVRGQRVAYATVHRPDASAYQGTDTTVRAGVEGRRTVTYRLTFRNGVKVRTTVTASRTTRRPVAAIISVGTLAQPAPAAPDYSGGSSVWDKIARCESGGNWSTNTGNGYYGGLQFNLGTWHGYGGSGLPSNNSREEQIRIAEKVRAATGGYGSWPACSRGLGLPQ